MAKSYSEFYPGKKQKKRRPALIASIVVLTLIAVALLLFYGLQKYIVITNDGLHLDIPMLSGSTSRIEVNDEGQNVRVFTPVEIELIEAEADYGSIKAIAGENLTDAVKAVFIPASRFSADTVRSEAAGLEYGNALVIEVKPNSGALVYNSKVEFAQAYGTAGQADLAALVKEIKDGEKDVYLVAEVNCLIDTLVPGRNPKVALKTADGASFENAEGAWVDPYNAEYRRYIVSLCKELSDMGFDEIELNGVKQPAVEEGTVLVYPSTSNPNVTASAACSGFAMSMARSLKGISAAVSVRLNSDAAFAYGTDEVSGQNAELFFKLYDRIYYYVDSYNAASAIESAQQYVELGDVNLRFVPVCYGSTPDTDCWVFTQG